MKTKPIAFLACRILAITFFMRALILTNTAFISLVSFRSYTGDPLLAVFYLIVPPALFLGGGIILWARADGISSRMVRGVEVDETCIQVGYQELQTVGFSIVGLIILTTVIPDIFAGIPEFISLNYTRQYDIPMVRVQTAFWIIEKVIRLAIGSLLLFGSRAVVHFVSSIRTVGVDRVDES